jgi:glycosyltransferase involved in cell wall biosynthesis
MTATAPNPANISIITTCKNRLSHLRQTLPFNSQFDWTEVVVVDYGCEEGTASWVAQNHPEVTLVQVKDDPFFNLSRARNIGARHAKGNILCFLDADVTLILDLPVWAMQNFSRNHFYVVKEKGMGTGGFAICHRDDFNKVGGYDEALRGWAPEDVDFYERLEFAGVTQRTIPTSSIAPIVHNDDLRAFGAGNGGFGDRDEAFALGQFYLSVKRDVRHITRREPELEFRKNLVEEMKRLDEAAVAANSASFELVINLGRRPLLPSAKQFSTVLSYRLDRRP